jgi:hypothetical protein
MKREEEGKPKSRMLLVLDDNGTQTRKLQKEGGMLDDILTKCRHYGITDSTGTKIYTVKSYFA